MKLGGCNLRQKSEKMSWSLIKSSTMEPRKHTVALVSINKQNCFWLEIADIQFEEDKPRSQWKNNARFRQMNEITKMKSADCPENDAMPAKGKHSAIVFARCVCEEYGSTGNCLFLRDSLIEMVSQRANSVCVSRRFIMLCHADLRPNKLYVFKPIDL